MSAAHGEGIRRPFVRFAQPPLGHRPQGERTQRDGLAQCPLHSPRTGAAAPHPFRASSAARQAGRLRLTDRHLIGAVLCEITPEVAIEYRFFAYICCVKFDCVQYNGIKKQ